MNDRMSEVSPNRNFGPFETAYCCGPVCVSFPVVVGSDPIDVDDSAATAPLLSSLLPSLGVESHPASDHTLLAARKEFFRVSSRCCPHLCRPGVERRSNRKFN
jgi:hypothetical protein